MSFITTRGNDGVTRAWVANAERYVEVPWSIEAAYLGARRTVTFRINVVAHFNGIGLWASVWREIPIDRTANARILRGSLNP